MSQTRLREELKVEVFHNLFHLSSGLQLNTQDIKSLKLFKCIRKSFRIGT